MNKYVKLCLPNNLMMSHEIVLIIEIKWLSLIKILVVTVVAQLQFS